MTETQQFFTFQITKLELTKPNDPKQFKIVLGYPGKQQQVESEVINSSKVKSYIPIKLKIKQKSIVVKLVQLKKIQIDMTKQQIRGADALIDDQEIRGSCAVQIDENKSQEILLEAEEGDSPKQIVCKIKYRGNDKDADDQQNPQQAGQQQNNKGEQNSEEKKKEEEYKNQSENKNGGNSNETNKKNYEELLKELSEIKNSVEKMINKTTKEKESAGEEKDIVQAYFEKGEESEAVKWYRGKYNKEKPGKPFTIQTSSDEEITEFDPIMEMDENSQGVDGENIQFAGLGFQGQIQPKVIEFNKKENAKPILTLTCPEQAGNRCKRIFELPKSSILYITVANIAQVNFHGCLEISEQADLPHRTPIFDSEGQVVGVLTFTCKKLGVKFVQTIQLIEENSQEENSDKEKNEKSECQSEFESKSGRRKGDYRKQKLTRDRYAGDHQKKQKKNGEDSPPKAARDRQNSQEDPLQKLDHIRIPGKIRSHRNQDELTNSRATNSRVASRLEDPKEEVQTKNRPQSRRKLQNNAYFQPNRYKTMNPQQTPRQNSMNNSTSAYYAPLKKDDSLAKSKRYDSVAINSYSDSINRPKTPNYSVSFKIHSASVKLKNSPDLFVGKFLKFQTKGSQPYITEMISLTKHLNWKLKGCFFEKISIFNELLINIYSQQTEFPKLEGTAKIRLALLSLDEPNKIHFYQDYIRNSQTKQIGQIIIGYEVMQAPQRLRNEKLKVQNEQKKPGSSHRLKTQKLKINLRNSSAQNGQSPISDTHAQNLSSRQLQKSAKFKNRPVKVIDESGNRSRPKY